MQRAKEGDLYGIFQVFGKTFEIYYGYYEEYERSSPYNDPVPIYPDLLKSPQYDENGSPIVTEMQLSCEHYKAPSRETNADGAGIFNGESGCLGFAGASTGKGTVDRWSKKRKPKYKSVHKIY